MFSPVFDRRVDGVGHGRRQFAVPGQRGLEQSGEPNDWKISVRATKSVSQLNLDHHAEAPALGGRRGDDACVGGPAGLLRGHRHPALAQELDRLGLVAAGFQQRFLALHHPDVGLVAEFLHQCCTDLCHDC
jgi:hypothetical protein